MIRRLVGIVLVTHLSIYFLHCIAFTLKCPESSQWYLRSDNKCIDGAYMCLFDTKESTYKEICGKGAEIAREGKMYILKPNPTEVDCFPRRYQPYTFSSVGNKQCIFSKSNCQAEGLVLADNGTSIKDRTCRCDYRRNYDYVIRPNDPCSCKPDEEDCSCYIRKCDSGKVMLPDYRCVQRDSIRLPEDIMCSMISGNRVDSKEETTTFFITPPKLIFSLPSTWSKEASAVLIVVISIYIVLIGFLFLSVPQIKRMSLNSKCLYLKSKDSDFMVIKGTIVKLECNVKSYLPVRSITWQRENNCKIIQITPSDEKYETVFAKTPSLTIHNFNVEDQGKYKCIVKNIIGLRNEIFGSIINNMLKIGWLTRFVKVLQHIPAFYTEYITLNDYDINLQSKPTRYNVYKGDDITMEQCCDDQMTLIEVKWLKKNDKWSEMDLTDERYSGGAPYYPPLIIKNAREEDAGNYFGILIYDNEVTKTFSFEIKIILQVKIYKAILEHRVDKTFVRPAICDNIYKHMEENNIVVITGREGTGKSKIVLELASFYDEKDYRILKVDLSDDNTIYTGLVDALLIIDVKSYTKDCLKAFMQHLSPVLLERNIKAILTCRNFDFEIVRHVLEINELKDDLFVDINSVLTSEEKEQMLKRHMAVNNVTASYMSNFRDPRIIIDFSVQVKLDDDTIKAIKNTEPWKGYPMSVSLFCSARKFLYLGEKYFTHPPIYVLEEMKELYETARNSFSSMNTKIEYCILVYITINRNHQLDLCDQNLCTRFVELYLDLFKFRYIHEHPCSNENHKQAIQTTLLRMNNKYLKFQKGVYKLIHPCLLKAVLLSSDSMIYYLLQCGSIHDITDFVRSKQFTGFENELFIQVDEVYYGILCERLVEHVFKNNSLLLHVAHYIYLYWHSSGNALVNEIFSNIEFNLFRRLGSQLDSFPLFVENSVSENSIEVENQILFYDIIMLVNALTYNGRDPWIYGPGTRDFLILSGLVTAAMDRYAINRTQTFDVLLSEFKNRIHSKPFVKLWSNHLDIYGNTFFHYLMLFNQIEVCQVLSVIKGGQNKFIDNAFIHIKNVKKYTPIEIAAYLGKGDVLEVLNLKNNCTKTLRDGLLKLTKRGNERFHEKNFKHTHLKRAMVHKPNCGAIEDGDDDKKQGNYESDQMEILYQRSEDKNNATKKPNKNYLTSEFIDVLCFPDFLINVVDVGREQDYQSSIVLLSK